MPAFRPSWVVNFKLKFDSALTVVIPPEPDSVEQRVENPPQGDGRVTTEPLILQPEDDQVQLEGAGAVDAVVLARVPKTASYEKPGYRQAGKFKLTIDFRDMPIDPRTVQAASVEIHTGTVSDENFRDGFRGGRIAGTRASILQTRTPEGLPNSQTLRFVGVVDDWHVQHSDSGSVVTISGRDLRGLLIDVPINVRPNAAMQMLSELNYGQPIDRLVKQILSFNPFFEEITVVTNPEDWPNGVVPAPGAADIVPRHRKGARGRRSNGRGTPNSSTSGLNMNFWDAIVRVCFLVGGIPYFRDRELTIRPASTVFDQLRGPVDPETNPTPFAGGVPRSRDVGSGGEINPELRTRRLVYGRDVRELSFDRKMAGWRKPKVIRTVGYNPDSSSKGNEKVLLGFYPPVNTVSGRRARVTARSPGRDKTQTEVVSIPVPGITDPKRLTEIAKSIYEELGRGELGGKISTPNLASFGGGNSDPDLLRLEPGDGIELLVDARSVRSGQPLVSTLTDDHRASFGERVSDLTNILGNQNLARVIVATARNQVLELQRFFRVQNVKYAWDKDSGIKVAFDFQNYFVVRAQAETASDRPGQAQKVATPVVP